MAIEEKLLTVPLKKSWIDRPKLKRHTSAANAIRQYFYKHMKAEDVKISSGVNNLLHRGGSKWVPGRIQVKAIKEGEVVNVLLPDEKMKPKKIEKKTIKEKLLGKSDTKEKLSLEERKELEEFTKKKESGNKTVETEKKEDKTEKPKEDPKTEISK